MSTVTYQLKYCERCGSLRLRPADSAETYCPPCEQALFNLPWPAAAPRSALLPEPPEVALDLDLRQP